MKRNLFFIIFVIAMAVLLISCKGTQTCSYAKKDTTNPNSIDAIMVETVVAE